MYIDIDTIVLVLYVIAFTGAAVRINMYALLGWMCAILQLLMRIYG